MLPYDGLMPCYKPLGWSIFLWHEAVGGVPDLEAYRVVDPSWPGPIHTEGHDIFDNEIPLGNQAPS